MTTDTLDNIMLSLVMILLLGLLSISLYDSSQNRKHKC